MSECHACGQPDPVMLKHLLRLPTLTLRCIPGLLWVRVSVRATWERPNYRPLLSGIVDRWAAGPVVVTVLPDSDPSARVERAAQFGGAA